MKRFLLIALLLFAPLTAVAAEVGAQAAVHAHMECVANNAAKLDDGKMDPKQLAEMIVPLCRADHEAAMHASMPQASEESIGRLELPHTLAAVHWYRNQAKNHSTNAN